MSPRVTFYDLPPQGRWPEVARLAEAAWRKETRLLILCGDPAEARAFDDFLWTFREDAFVPHELAPSGGAPLADPDARIVIVTEEATPIKASVLVQLSPGSMAFAESFRSVIDLVDHRDEARLAASRARYKAWVATGAKPDYRKLGPR